VDEMLLTLREQRRVWDPVDRAPEENDQVLFEYVAQLEDQRVPEEGHQRLAIIMGASGFESLESALSGLKAEDETTAELEFPENYREPALAGQTAQVELKVTTVSESSLPEIDEDFVKSFEVEDGTLESLCVEVSSNLEREQAQASTSLTKRWIVDALVNVTPGLDVPASIVRQEAASLANRVASQEGREATEEESDAYMETATERVRGGLLMGEIAQQNSIRIDGAKVRAAIETIAQTYQDPSEVVQLYYNNPQLLSQVENSVLEEQVVDWVLENAKVSDKEMKFQDVISAASGANA
jgi:trigger factor